MKKREDYEHLELDNDGNYYWFMNKDVDVAPYPQELKEFVKWFSIEELKYKESSLYYKGTRLYFTYKHNKYYVGWVFYGRKLIEDAIVELEKLGATNIQINYGELD